MKTVSCAAPYGGGGLGQHLAYLVEAARSANRLERYYANIIREGDAAGRAINREGFSRLMRYTPARFSPGWQAYLHGDLFDRAVATLLNNAATKNQITEGAAFVGFAGQAEHSLQQAKRTGYGRLEVVAANSHVEHVARQHALARRAHGLEATWVNAAYVRKCRTEYALADAILVNSDMTGQTFVAAGIPEAKIQRVQFETASRFQPPVSKPDDGVFRVAYVGSLTITKGIPLLLEAFSRLGDRRAELTLVGGWATRGMRACLQGWMARDARIQIVSGDPLPTLQRADVYVHPSYEDGWAYAPMEALACGVPVIVTADTGMKERVQEGVNGYVVPTGDWRAILERLEQIRSHPLPTLFAPP